MSRNVTENISIAFVYTWDILSDGSASTPHQLCARGRVAHHHCQTPIHRNQCVKMVESTKATALLRKAHTTHTPNSVKESSLTLIMAHLSSSLLILKMCIIPYTWFKNRFTFKIFGFGHTHTHAYMYRPTLSSSHIYCQCWWLLSRKHFVSRPFARNVEHIYTHLRMIVLVFFVFVHA